MINQPLHIAIRYIDVESGHVLTLGTIKGHDIVTVWGVLPDYAPHLSYFNADLIHATEGIVAVKQVTVGTIELLLCENINTLISNAKEKELKNGG